MRPVFAPPPGLPIAVLPVVLLASAGCFSERSFPARAVDLQAVARRPDAPSPRDDARAWLRHAHPRIEHLLPPSPAPALLTDDLFDADGRPIDVFTHFGVDPRRLHSIFGNLSGLMHTAQAAGARPAIDRPPPDWPGFEDVWIPIRPGLCLSARLGLARDSGRPRRADCIVILPGLLGDNAVLRTRHLASALRDAGLHALALELRGHGQTEARHPDVAYAFGTLEIGDLMAVAEWLQRRDDVHRTGLVGFCWSANLALIAAWEDGRRDDDPLVPERLRPFLRPRRADARHFEAGVIAFSPTLRFETILERTVVEQSRLCQPVLDALQDTVRDRMIRKRYPRPSGDLRRLIELDMARSDAPYEGSVDDGLQYLRLLPHRGLPAGDKLEAARVPVLIVHGANDPLAPAQDVAELCAPLRNPRVAAVVLPGGGHVGFAPYARSYFYSLVLSFFEAPAVHDARTTTEGVPTGPPPGAARE